MAPPIQALDLDIAALSGICGSISIACWVVVFSPQIVENFRRRSADGLSLQFILVWLAGDVFNILGAVLQGVLPTMVILALYYTIADIVLLGQCFYYRGFTFSDAPAVEPLLKPALDDDDDDGGDIGEPTVATGLLSPPSHADRDALGRRWSGEHLSPAVPMLAAHDAPSTVIRRPRARPSRVRAALLNIFAILMVCLAGILGWYFSSGTQRRPQPHHGHSHGHGHHGHHTTHSTTSEESETALTFNLWGQIFGYLCALLYLLSRLPQILLNYRRKSTEGVSMLFFLFACIGNLTYVLSILAFEPRCLMDEREVTALSLSSSSSFPASSSPSPSATCSAHEARRIYARYMAVNASWLLGSAGTLVLDFAIFCQFFYYREKLEEEGEDVGEAVDEQRPLLG